MGKANIHRAWFQGKLADREVSQRQLAKRLNLDPAAVSLMFRGKRKIQTNEAARMAAILGVPLDEVLAHAGVKVDEGPGTIPVVGVIGGGGEVTMGKAPGPIRVPAPVGMSDEACALRWVSHGSVMNDVDGCIVYYEPRDDVKPDIIGRYVIAELKGNGPTMLGFVKRGYTDGKYVLVAARGGVVLEDVELKKAGLVGWMRMF